MAEHVLAAGHPLVVYDTESPKAAGLAARGATLAADLADVARQARIVISMVETTAQTEQVIVGAGGLMDAASPGGITMSTIDPSAIQRMNKILSERSVALVDAPVAATLRRSSNAGLCSNR